MTLADLRDEFDHNVRVRDLVSDVNRAVGRLRGAHTRLKDATGAAADTLEKLRGKVWKKVVSTDEEREAMEKSFKVISTHLVGGLHEVRVYADASPGDGFESAEADLEDVYFLNLGSADRN